MERETDRLSVALRGALAWWRAEPPRTRRWVVGAGGVLAALLAVTVAFGGGAEGPGVRVRAAGPPPTVTETPAAGGEDKGGTPSPTPTPLPPIGSVDELVSQYGYPAGYDFAEVRIPILGVDAPVGVSVVDGSAGAQLASPEGPATALWYDLSAWPGMGGVPGAGGNAVFGAHVDISGYLPYADVNYHGPAVFRDLYLLKPGDEILVDYNGATLTYVVQWSEWVERDDGARWGEIWSSDVEVDSITLYTCGGDFDWDTREYPERLVVRAARS